MALPDDFEERGFLSEGIANGIAETRGDAEDWFALAEDANAVLMATAKAATETVKTGSWAPEAVAVRALLRACGTFQGVILLCERGMVPESRTLVRSLIEDAFCISALLGNSDAFIEMLKKDSETSRHKQRKFIIANKLLAEGAQLEKLKATVEEMEKPRMMNLREIAETGALIAQYLAYQRLSDDSAHLSARSLDRHILADKARKRWRFKWSVGDKGENSTTLHQAMLAVLGIGVGITQLLEDKKGNAEFGRLAERLNAMPDVPVL